MLYEKLKAIICEFFELDEDEVTPDTAFADIGADSLDMVEIAMSIEDDFRIEVTEEALAKFVTVEDAVNYIEAAL